MIAAVRPHSLDEAVRYLGEDPALVPTAGCTDLMVRGPEALHRMDRVIDLLGIPELRGIREIESGLEIGATTSFTEIRRSAALRAAFPILAEAAGLVGGWQIQNRATLGGNMRRFRIRVLAGDRVTIEVSPYDLTRGRITFRHKN